MTKNILLSVIIPCYNCEKYIYDCLKSVYQQLDNNVEVIIINDGSTDHSLARIDAFINEFNHHTFNVFSQKNQGLSSTRNTGIRLARGAYLAFLDGDDLWNNKFWRTIKPLIKEHSVELIEFNANRFYYDDKNTRDLIPIVDKTAFTKINKINDLAWIFKKNEWFAWARVYKKELFNSIRFPVGIHYEDMATLPLIYNITKTILSIKDELVFYRVRHGSITNTFTPSDIDDIIQVMEVLNRIKIDNEPYGFNVVKPAIITTFKLAKRVSTNIYGYCFFNDQQAKKIKTIIHPFIKEERVSFYIKTRFLREWCLINKIKYELKKRYPFRKITA